MSRPAASTRARILLKRKLKALYGAGTTLFFSHALADAGEVCTAIEVIDHARLRFTATPQALIREQHAAQMENPLVSVVERAAMLPLRSP